MKTTIYLMMMLNLIFFASCDSPEKVKDEDERGETMAVDSPGMDNVFRGNSMEQGGITLSIVKGAKQFENASLKLNEPADGAALEPGKINYTFEVSDYNLGEQTPDADQMGLANSPDGQHIHLIINNGPYSAHYSPQFQKEMEAGKHVVLAFLSRSYHMSLKNKNAMVLRQVTVGDGKSGPDFNMDDPHLFYSRPKGEYKGKKQTDKVLLDFYLHNVELGQNGNKVKATINGNEFILSRWVPYAMEGLPMGENTVKIELIDEDGNVIPGPFNSTTRTFTLSE
ncbi:MAG: hypothetical protein WD077_05010 [Bacteroidia bacterium]